MEDETKKEEHPTAKEAYEKPKLTQEGELKDITAGTTTTV